jgi:hypothetical protein
MDPLVVVVTFIAVATDLAVFRVVAQQREMSRAVRVPRTRRRSERDLALQRLREAADILRDVRQ